MFFLLVYKQLKGTLLQLHNFVLLNHTWYNLGILLQLRCHSHICKKHQIALCTCNSHLVFLCKKVAVQQNCTLLESQRYGHICHYMDSFERSIYHLLNIFPCESFDCYCKSYTQANILYYDWATVRPLCFHSVGSKSHMVHNVKGGIDFERIVMHCMTQKLWLYIL